MALLPSLDFLSCPAHKPNALSQARRDIWFAQKFSPARRFAVPRKWVSCASSCRPSKDALACRLKELGGRESAFQFLVRCKGWKSGSRKSSLSIAVKPGDKLGVKSPLFIYPTWADASLLPDDLMTARQRLVMWARTHKAPSTNLASCFKFPWAICRHFYDAPKRDKLIFGLPRESVLDVP